MSEPSMRQIVKDFVKGSLGCQCPDEVFKDIQFLMGDSDLRILIEKRLIVRLMPLGKKALCKGFYQDLFSCCIWHKNLSTVLFISVHVYDVP